MRKLLIFGILLIGWITSALCQENDNSLHFSILNQVIEEHLGYELESRKFEKRNVYIMYTPLTYIEGGNTEPFLNRIKFFEDVQINYVTAKEIKTISKKEEGMLRIYPIKIENDNSFSVLVESYVLGRKKNVFAGRSIYKYKYSCVKESFVLVDKSHAMF
ncbi:MAG: hypothetical protein AAF554_03650 [Bacteroidota bacterium]